MRVLNTEREKFRQGYRYVVGTDEVGRGCLAGPVVAAAVAFDDKLQIQSRKLKELQGVRDSKALSASQRELLDPIIKEVSVAWSVGVVSPKIIDKINIHKASLRAMQISINKSLSVIASECSRGKQSVSISSRLPRRLSVALESPRNNNVFLFVDGKFVVPNILIEQEAVVHGDAKIFSVACASIIAKVYRDALMRKLHVKLPQYNFEKHKGYGTSEHEELILKYGVTEHHRKTFCKKFLV